MKLTAFKALHGIEQLEFKTSKRTGRRVVVNTILPIVISKNCDLTDLTKELMIGLYTSTAGTEVYSIHHEGGWMDNGDGTL
tara:strand:- start:3301 stop:3543 length:243 start_codon:yes stop_codon:yes gene_type:complete